MWSYYPSLWWWLRWVACSVQKSCWLLVNLWKIWNCTPCSRRPRRVGWRCIACLCTVAPVEWIVVVGSAAAAESVEAWCCLRSAFCCFCCREKCFGGRGGRCRWSYWRGRWLCGSSIDNLIHSSCCDSLKN